MVIIRKLFICLASFLLFFSLQTDPLTAKAAQSTIQIAVHKANIRSEPSMTSSVIGQADRNEQYSVLKEKYDWYQIQLDNGKKGWVAGYIVTKTHQANRSSSSNSLSGTIQIAVNKANVRSEPSKTASVIAQADRNEQYQVMKEKYGWYQIQLANGKKGWVAGYIVIKGSGGTQQAVKGTSSKKTGTITADNLHVRNSPSLSAGIMGKLHIGDQVTVAGTKNDWVNITYKSQDAWVNKQFIRINEANKLSNTQASVDGFAVILHDRTNIRSAAGVSSSVVTKGSQGERYPIIGREGDWYKITLASGRQAYVASWVVSVNGEGNASTAPSAQTTQPNASRSTSLQGKTIVLDPGHGGKDPGATSMKGTFEKYLTMQTSQLLYQKLTKAGATVILTRSNDSYVSLPSRVSASNHLKADAFISIHYDSTYHAGANGFTTYYKHGYQETLAKSVNKELTRTLPLKDRGTRQGDYYVIRENSQPAILLELGYLSNPREGSLIVTTPYQESVTNSIYNGLNSYFSR
ncbi:SH3 domain-containing protein [Bacillus aerolatus]|uniref:SH3 domain-containing protein n=1 Tax=Bacillus aerolatus TaxID=2653354 RepID=A0A6I1FGR4_9BACI|nr:N-acetylmuramoyl-L-alanine amidase [Bacillus aerolatus]KAB7707412.1 SH3 domain-containing protein [Bacillus aerolatus]